MAIETGGLSHVAIRVTDQARAKQFYTQALGFQIVLENEHVLLLNANGMLLGIRGAPTEQATGGRFDPFRVGLDHIALAVPDTDKLTALKGQLDAANVPHHGIEQDAMTGASYIAFYDPDGIAWELYVMPAH